MLHTRIHLHTVLADMDIEPYPPEPEWASEEEVLERGGGSLRLPCKRIRPSGSRLNLGCRRKNGERSCPLLMFPPKVTRNNYRPSFFFFLSFFGPLCNIISTASAASEEGGLLLLDAEYCHRMRRKNHLKVQYYSYFLISRFIQDTEPFMMSHTHVLALIFWEVSSK